MVFRDGKGTSLIVLEDPGYVDCGEGCLLEHLLLRYVIILTILRENS